MSGTWHLARNQIASIIDGLTLGALLDLSYDNEASGPFTVGETLTFEEGGTALLLALTDAGATGTMQVRMLSGNAPADDEGITGGTSSATADVDGTPAGLAAETMTFFEYLTPGRQDISTYPYGYILPAEVVVERMPSSWRAVTVDAVARFFIGGPAAAEDFEVLHQQYDGWVDVLIDAWDSAVALNGAADVSAEQTFGGLASFGVEPGQGPWGFEMTLPIRVSEPVAFSA